MNKCSVSALVGRVLLGGAFLVSGIFSATSFNEFVSATESVLPFATFFAAAAIAFKIIGGLSLVLGIYTRVGAAMLIVFTVLATFLFHFDFASQQNTISFLKNTMVVGGLLGFFAFGGGKYAIYDCCKKKKSQDSQDNSPKVDDN